MTHSKLQNQVFHLFHSFFLSAPLTLDIENHKTRHSEMLLTLIELFPHLN